MAMTVTILIYCYGVYIPCHVGALTGHPPSTSLTSFGTLMSHRSSENLTTRLDNRFYREDSGVVLGSPVIRNTSFTTSGVENPNWKIQVAKHQDATTTYESFYISDRGRKEPLSVQSFAKFKNPAAPNKYYNWYAQAIGNFVDLNSGVGSDVNVTNRALSKIKNKIANDSKQFKALVPLGEAKELHGLVKQTMALTGNVLGLLIDVKKGNAKSAYARASDIWLGFNFGVRPLISDTIAVAESIAAYVSRPPTVETYRGSSSADQQIVLNRGLVLDAVFCTIELEDVINWTYTDTYGAGIIMDLHSANSYSDLNTQLGMPIQNLLPAAWELVPYSWVVDYFSNVGDIINDQFYSLPGLTSFLYRTETTRSTITFRVRCKQRKSVFPDFYDFSPSDDSITMKMGYIKRSKLSVLPHRTFSIKSPDQIASNGLTKLLNLAAVLAPKHR